jgi:hypothetical protein
MRSLLVLFFLLSVCFAGSVRIDPIPVAGSQSDQDYLQYDDGSAQWLSWDGMYRGVWFNTDDFVPSMLGFDLDFTEYWMYHHASYPWDISDFFAEVWDGSISRPLDSLNQTQITAIHYAPVIANYNPQVSAETQFWALENTEMSTGGWPSMLGDGSPPYSVDHSYYSADFFIWEPWSDGSLRGDFFIRAEGDFGS